MAADAATRVLDYAASAAEARARFFQANAARMARLGLRAACILAGGNKILLCGNGGGAQCARAAAAALMGRCRMDRPPLPALFLRPDRISGLPEDKSCALARQVAAFGAPGDMLVVFAASGLDASLCAALETARGRSLYTLVFTSEPQSGAAPVCDALLALEPVDAPSACEVLLGAGHVLCAMTDYYLFENVSELTPYLVPGAQLPD